MAIKREWISGNGYKSLVYLHIIFVVKYRRKVISEEIGEEIGEEMKSIFKDVLEKNGSQLIECGYEDDHIHLLIKSTTK